MRSIKHYAGKAAATTLGYAFGNLPGAYGAYKAYDKYDPDLPKEEMSYSRKRKYTTGTNSSNKRASTAKKATARKRVRKATAPKLYSVGVKTYKAKAVRVKSARVPKIAPGFRKKVLQAVEAPKTKGHYECTYQGGGLPISSIASNSQYVINGCSGVTDGNYHFTVDNFINMASICFNGGHLAKNATDFQPDFAGRFTNSHNMSLFVRDSGSRYVLANNSIRALNVKVIEIKPKDPLSFVYGNQLNAWYWTGSAWSSVADITDQSLLHPQGEWTKATEKDNQLNAVSSSTGAAYSTVPVTKLYNHPNRSPTFKTRWVSQTIKEFKFEPGQEIAFNIQGPKNLEINVEKCFINGKYLNVQPKYTRGIMFVVYPDLVAGATSGFGRITNAAVANGGIGIERTDYYNFSCPDIATEGNVKDVSIYDDSSVGALGAATVATDETFVST